MTSTRYPAEWEPHELTFMQWPACMQYPAYSKIAKDEWPKIIDSMRKDVARVATAIADYEPVVVLVSPDQVESAEKYLDHPNIKTEKIQLNDLWARDTMPAFTFKGNELHGTSFNFNGWGGKLDHEHDKHVASKTIEKYNLPEVKSWLVAEGGAIECDGSGTILATKSSIFNENRNPGKSLKDIEDELKRTLGVEKVIWLDGVYGKDITDAHVDCIVRFIRPGVVLLNRRSVGTPPDEWTKCFDQARSVLEKETDAQGNSFKIIEMFEPDPSKYEQIGDDFAPYYVNFYIANGAVIVPAFGDQEADMKAQDILRNNFPGRKIVPVHVSALPSGGGVIHCSTHELPLRKK